MRTWFLLLGVALQLERQPTAQQEERADLVPLLQQELGRQGDLWLQSLRQGESDCGVALAEELDVEEELAVE